MGLSKEKSLWLKLFTFVLFAKKTERQTES